MRILNRKKHLIGAGLFVIAFLGWALLYDPRPNPSDDALIDYFNQHRIDFDRLVSMANEDDSVRAIYGNEVMWNDGSIRRVSVADGVSTERWNEYRNVFARLNEYENNSITKRTDQLRISASIDVSELDNLESVVVVKGYAYSVSELTPLVDSLDNMAGRMGSYYRRIDQHWYLYYDQGITKPE